jgi:hypothetical protein
MSIVSEYSFFRAAGFSLAAIQTAERERQEVEKLKTALCDKFGAAGLACGMRDGHLQIWHFSFQGRPPKDWENVLQITSYILARPKAPADQMLVAAFAGLIERHFRRTVLEYHFGCGDLPEKDLLKGDYDTHFVKRKSIKDPSVSEPTRYSHTRMNPTSYSPGHMIVRDDLDYMSLDGSWYIRVPNDAEGNPRIIPPDAEPVSFDHMVTADRNDHNRGLSPSMQIMPK